MKRRYRHRLPQLSGELFLTDAGMETDLIFNRGVELREFAAHTALESVAGRQALIDYYRGFLSLARAYRSGFILDSTTWKAHPHWANDLGATPEALEEANHRAVELIAELRDEYDDAAGPIVLNGVVGPRGDAYAPEAIVGADEAEAYHARQVGWLAATDVDMITGMTFTQASEAVGLVRAARKVDVPLVVSFTLETDGRLPNGQSLAEAITEVDAETDGGAAYFMVNCAHPDHFATTLSSGVWRRRVRGFRCNASRCSHAELDAAETLDSGNPLELGQLYRALVERMPWANVFGGCCGSDIRHLSAIVSALQSAA